MKMAQSLIFTGSLKIIFNRYPENAKRRGKSPFPDHQVHFRGNVGSPIVENDERFVGVLNDAQVRRRMWSLIRSSQLRRFPFARRTDHSEQSFTDRLLIRIDPELPDRSSMGIECSSPDATHRK